MSEPTGIIVFGILEQATAVWPNLFEPKAFKRNGKEQGEPKYGITFLLTQDHPDLPALKKKAIAVAKEKWPGADVKSLKFPFLSGASQKKKAEANGKNGDFYDDMVVLKSSTKYPPSILDGRNDPPTDVVDQKLVQSGSKVAAEINFVAYDGNDGKDGVTAYINTVVYVSKGTRIAGRDAAAAFRGISGQSSSEDPTGGLGMDDDIAF